MTIFAQVECAGHQNDAHDGHRQRKFRSLPFCAELRRAAHQRVFAVGRPAGERHAHTTPMEVIAKRMSKPIFKFVMASGVDWPKIVNSLGPKRDHGNRCDRKGQRQKTAQEK